MSTSEVVQLLALVDSPVPSVRQPALARIRELRRANPGVVRAAARQLGAEAVSRGAVPAGGWANWIGEQRSQPLRVVHPSTEAELVGAVQSAADQGLRIRAVASGHSTSAAARPDDGSVAVNLSKLDRILPVKWARDPLPARWTDGGARLVRVQAGATVRSTSIALHARGLAFANTGSFDGQQLVGALCTGTHGSGVGFGPLADIAASLDLVAVNAQGRARIVRIEPSDGPTDPARYSRGPLIQDDAVFRCAVVAFGSLGVVVGLTVRVVPKFWVREVRTPRSWSWLRTRLTSVAASGRRVDVHINPYEEDGDHAAVVITRDDLPWRDEPAPPRPDDLDFVRSIAKLVGTDVLGWAASTFPGLIADGIQRYCERPGTFESASYKVLITGYGDDIEATSSEFAVSLEHAPAMVDAVLAIARARRDGPKEERFRHSSPLGLRFVARGGQALAMHRDPVNATLEIPFVMGSKNAELALATYEAALPLARPHWGQVTSIDAGRAAMLYGADWSTWKRVRADLDPGRRFTSAFTERLGV